MQNFPVWLQQSCLSRIFFLPLVFVSLGRSWQGVGSQSHLIVSWKRSSDWNIWKKHPLLLGQHFENESLSSGLNLFCEKSCWKSCNGRIDDDPGMNDVCWDTSCPCMSDQVTETVCTHTHTPPRSNSRCQAWEVMLTQSADRLCKPAGLHLKSLLYAWVAT